MGMKNSIINLFNGNFIYIVTTFTKHSIGFNKFMAKMQGMTNGVRAFVTNKNPTLFLAHEQQTFYASTCTKAEFSYFMFVM